MGDSFLNWPEEAGSQYQDEVSRVIASNLLDPGEVFKSAVFPWGIATFLHSMSSLAFVLLPPGEVLRSAGCSTRRPVVSSYLLISRTPCTQEAWDRASHFQNLQDEREWRGPDLPIEGVSWEDAMRFCGYMGMDLPTEVEWEYAARGGTGSLCYFDDMSALRDHEWYFENSGGRTRPVSLKLPNQYGLYDLYGNVSEWCKDDWVPEVLDLPTDGLPYLSGDPDEFKVFRGGGWAEGASSCSSEFRYPEAPDVRTNWLGFRPVMRLP